MKKLIVFCLSLVLSLCLVQAALAEDALFPIREDGLWGYMNASGETVIAPQFSWAGAFRGAGYAAVEAQSTEDDMYACGVIDRTGKYVVEPKYASDEGYDGYYYGGKDTGVIWLMEEENGRMGFFDVASGYFSGAVYNNPPLHVSDSRLINVSKDDLVGFVDRTTGKLVIKYQYATTGDWQFTNGYAYVEMENKDGELVPLMIDESGKKISLPDGVEPAENACMEDGLFPVLEADSNLYGYANAKGKLVIAPAYDEVDFFKDGYANVVLEGDPLVIDTTGAVAVRPETAAAGATLDLRGDTDTPEASIVDANGNVVVPFSAGYLFDTSYAFGYDDHFAEGVQVLIKDGQYGFLNEQGAVAIPFEYDYAENFEHGLAHAEQEGRMLYLNHAGQIVWQEK